MRCRCNMSPANRKRFEPRLPSARNRWYGQPVVWLGAALLLASIAAGVALIVVVSHYPEEPAPPIDRVLRVPLTRESQSPP